MSSWQGTDYEAKITIFHKIPDFGQILFRISAKIHSVIRLKIISYLCSGFRENPYRKSIKNVLRHIPTESSLTLSSPKDRGGLPKGRCEHCAKNDIAQDVFSLLEVSSDFL